LVGGGAAVKPQFTADATHSDHEVPGSPVPGSGFGGSGVRGSGFGGSGAPGSGFRGSGSGVPVRGFRGSSVPGFGSRVPRFSGRPVRTLWVLRSRRAAVN